MNNHSIPDLPKIIPMPKKVSKIANIVATLSGNSFTIILKDPVKKPEFPHASTILEFNKYFLYLYFIFNVEDYLSAKDKARNVLESSILSRSPKNMEVTPTVPMPKFKVNFIPILLRFAPIIGLTRNTVNSKIPKTKPYSDGTHPFFSASRG